MNPDHLQLREESRRMSEFAGIEFRSLGNERHACIQGSLPVWQLIEVARNYALDARKTAEHFGWPVEKVQAGFDYYSAFPEEIDRAIAENQAMGYERLKRLFPDLGVFTITDEMLDAVEVTGARAELFAPLHEDFARSGLSSEDDLDALIEQARDEVFREQGQQGQSERSVLSETSKQDEQSVRTAAADEARHRGLDELAALSQEMGLYEERRGTISVSESLYAYLRERAARRGITPDAFAEEILMAYREGR